MPFRYPSATIIRSYHFRDREYTFPVESTVGPEEGAGQLLIDVSPGYLLVTSAETTPKSSQTLHYVLQSDGSYLARATLTLVATGSGLINGRVTLRDPTNEVLILNVAIETQLFTSHSAITFPQTEPQESGSINLTIIQQGAHTPIVLSIDNPQQFSLATAGKNPHHTANLTLIPAFEGSTICVRYTPGRAGQHTARLLIQTPYTTRTLPLRGQASGWLGWVGLSEWPGRRILNDSSVGQSSSRVSQKLGLLLLFTLAGLAGIAYLYWNPLGASRQPLPSAVDSEIASSASRTVSDSVSASRVPPGGHLHTPTERNRTQQQADQRTDLTRRPTPQDSEQKSVTEMRKGSGHDLAKVSHSVRKRKPRVFRLAPDSITNQNEESDLEKELNQKKNR
ncbi:hypothetical protein [Spirosoma fluviale]|uniref:Uncharacterized protein n=1 Tax=Spirosoma fluviale TaxID=1597977 RepID=A0A286G5F3_9BACT|nr:hypothetical protein [Spirosoma fluviale]SOD90456.1 hypothetical protein SAMN06269250_3428 [Spirosoma fluviale]